MRELLVSIVLCINMLRKDPFVTGEYYHLYNRGIDKRVIFKIKKDYERFLMLLYLANSNEAISIDELTCRQQKTFKEVLVLEKIESLVSIGAWCLMPNHFHLLVRQEEDGGISKFMKKIGTGYSMFFNIKYDRKGALFGGPFKSKLVDDDNYMRHLFGYINLNSLEIKFPNWENVIMINSLLGGMKEFLKLYQYSSYPDYLGENRIEKNIITPKAFPGYFEDNQTFSDFIDDYLTEK